MSELLPGQIPTNEELAYRILAYFALLQRCVIEFLFLNAISVSNEKQVEQAIDLLQALQVWAKTTLGQEVFSVREWALIITPCGEDASIDWFALEQCWTQELFTLCFAGRIRFEASPFMYCIPLDNGQEWHPDTSNAAFIDLLLHGR